MSHPLHIIILAAGDGTRMRSSLPKVLQPVGGQPMLAHVLGAARPLQPAAVHVVYNPDSPGVQQAFAGQPINWVAQQQRLGTGHAVQQAMPDIPDQARVLVLYGDTPLVPAAWLQTLVSAADSELSLLTTRLADPTGYGRIVRDLQGAISSIVEQRDASDAQLSINEVNSGICLAAAHSLRGWLSKLRDDNSQGEFYLTDIVALAAAEGVAIGSLLAPEPALLEGANDRAQLARLERLYQAGCADALLRAGVTLADPARYDQRGQVQAGQDVFIDVNVVLEGHVTLGEGVSIGPFCVLRDCQLAAGTTVHAHSVLEGVHSHGACDIGPFARLRPGTELAEGTRIGNFVEVKNARLGAGSKANHLAYLGDAEIGEQVNIGAGTITCNYDGANKHRTVIGDGAFIGSDSQLVAPVTVGAGATIGAGSTITRDAPADQLTVTRAKQTSIKGWKRPVKKTGGAG
jgi:bifunctional UDP-N-acetylglucosamine pyrophosphorylase/glucosamine-1-phosphate N-acetyltransferase